MTDGHNLRVMSQGAAKAGHFKISNAPFLAVASLSSGCFVATSVRGAIGSAVARALPVSGFCVAVLGSALIVDVVGIGAQVSVKLVYFDRPPLLTFCLPSWSGTAGIFLIITAVSQRTVMAACMHSETLVKSRGAVQRRMIGRSVLGAAALLIIGFGISFGAWSQFLQTGIIANFGFAVGFLPFSGATALLVTLFVDWKNTAHKTMQQALERITSLTRSRFKVGHLRTYHFIIRFSIHKTTAAHPLMLETP